MSAQVLLDESVKHVVLHSTETSNLTTSWLTGWYLDFAA